MTPVNQSKLYAPDGIHNGDCYAACLASLLNLPLWMVPPFEQMFGRSDWRERVEEWLARFFALALERTGGHAVDSLPEFYIANGPARRGVHHSVIYRRGELVHDPHPAKDGLLEIEWTYHLRPLSSAEAKLVELRSRVDQTPHPDGEGFVDPKHCDACAQFAFDDTPSR